MVSVHALTIALSICTVTTAKIHDREHASVQVVSQPKSGQSWLEAVLITMLLTHCPGNGAMNEP
jgi:hypothetical protein